MPPASPSRNASTRTYSAGLSRLRDHSNQRLPASARVAAVNGATKSGQRSLHSGFVSNLTTMKIIAAPLLRHRVRHLPGAGYGAVPGQRTGPGLRHQRAASCVYLGVGPKKPDSKSPVLKPPELKSPVFLKPEFPSWNREPGMGAPALNMPVLKPQPVFLKPTSKPSWMSELPMP